MRFRRDVLRISDTPLPSGDSVAAMIHSSDNAEFPLVDSRMMLGDLTFMRLSRIGWCHRYIATTIIAAGTLLYSYIGRLPRKFPYKML